MKKLTEADFQQAALDLECEVAAIKAVAQVESKGAGFQSNGEPTILFERHVFSRLTKGKFDAQAPDISNPKPGGYGKTSAQHGRLAKAVALDRTAALMSASWGVFQIMGENYKQAGFSTVQEYITAMYRSEQEHLKALVAFIKADSRLLVAIRVKNFTRFAQVYNGPGYAKNEYDKKMHAAYRSLHA
jgi:hypothetical protein